jgi:hypothetical protein
MVKLIQGQNSKQVRHLLQGAESFFGTKKFPAFYGTRSCLLYSQVPATCPYSRKHALSVTMMSHVLIFAEIFEIFELYSNRHNLINQKTFTHHTISFEDQNIYSFLVYI